MTADGAPCEDCAQVSRNLVIGSIVVGAVLGAASVYLLLRR